MKKKLKRIRHKVEFILSTYPATRDSDKVLFIQYAKEYLGITDTTPFVEVVKDHELHFESLRRSRQWFQAKHQYESLEQIKARRFGLQGDFRDTFLGMQ